MASYSGVLAGAAFIKLTLNDAKLAEGLEKAQKNVQTFSQRAKAAFMSMEVLGDKAFGGFLTVAFPIATAVREFARFNDTIRTFKAISGASNQQMGAMETQIRNLGKTTAFTAKQVADGAVELSRMGLDVNEVGSALPAALNLVRATGEETFRLGEVSEFAAASLRIFNLDATKFEDVTDVMAYAANKSAMGVADLGEAMKIAGPSAHAIGENIRDASAALMLFANAGIKGSLAGTSLRKVYQSLAAVSGQTEGWSAEELEMGLRGKDQLMEMGIKVVDENGNLRKAQDIMVDLANAVKRMKSGEKINFATDVFDLRGSLGALSMLSNPKDLIRFRNELNTVGGYARKTAEEIEKGPGGQLRLLRSALEDLGLSFGGFMAKSLMPFIGGVKELSLALSTLFGWLGGFGEFLVQTSAGAMGAGVALWGITKALSAIGSGFAPLLAGIKWLDSYASGAKKAATEAEKLANASSIAVQNQAAIEKARKGLESAQNKLSNAKNEKAREAAIARLTDAQKKYAAANALATTSEGVLAVAKKRTSRAAQKKLALMLAANKESLWAAACNAKNAASLWAMSVAEIAAANGGTAYAIATKAAAGATLAFNAALNFIKAHPVLVALSVLAIAISAITSKIQKMKEEFQKTIDKARELTEEAENITRKNEKKRNTAKDYFERAKQLAEISKQAELTAEQMQQAEFIAKELDPFGGKGWLNLDKNTKKLLLAADAAEEFKKGLKGSATADVENEIKALENQIDKLIYKKVDITRTVHLPHGGVFIEKIGEKKVYRDDMSQDELKEMNSVYAKIRAARQRMMKEQVLASKNGYSAISGETKKYVELKGKEAKLQDDLDRASRSAYENKVNDIKKVRDEHKKYLEQLKEEARRLNKNDAVKMYDEKLKSIEAAYQKQLDDAKKAEEKRIADSWGNSKTAFEDIENKNKFDDKRQQQDEAVDKLLKSNSFDAALQALNDFIIAEKNIFADLKKEYSAKLLEFEKPTSLGGKTLDAEEKKQLDALRSAADAVNSRTRSWQDRINQVKEQAADFLAKDNTRVLGGFNASAIARALLGSGGTEAERTAKASEETNRILKDIKRLQSKTADYKQVYGE